MKTCEIELGDNPDSSHPLPAILKRFFSGFWSGGLESIYIILFFGAVNWLAHFSLARGFGLYEDDYFFISPAFGMSIHDVFVDVLNNFLKWPQGRPIGFSLPLILSFIGYQLDGLYGIYIIAFIILCLNTYLIYLFVKRFGPVTLALVSALAFSIFPADTTRSFLMHSLGLQPSITFLLIASLFYLDDKKGISYLFILGSLLTYETPFLVFWGIPFIQYKRDWHWVKQFLIHIFLLLGMTCCVLVVRTFTGDSRLEMGTSFMSIPVKILLAFVLGPLTSFGLFFYAPIASFLKLNAFVAFGIVVSLALVGFTFYGLILKPLEGSSRLTLVNHSILQPIDKWYASHEVQQLIRSGLIGLILLCLGYGLSFTHFPPTTYHGRLTSVHLAASVGGSILFASLSMLGLSIIGQFSLARIFIVALVLYFSFSVGYNTVIQEDFIKSWCRQRLFWTKTLPLIPDLADGTVILFPYDGSAETTYIHTHSWADPLILKQIFRFPENWSNSPRLYSVSANWLTLLSRNGKRIYWTVPVSDVPSHTEALPDSNLILLQQSNSSLSRETGTLTIQDQEFALKQPPPPSSVAPYIKKPLYDLLMLSGNQCVSNN